MHAVARLAFTGKMWDLFAFSVPSTVDLFTETFSSFHAFSTVFRKDGIVNALAALNTNLFAIFFDSFPFTHIRASSWARADAWVIFPAAIALHWAHTLMPPRNKDTFVVTSLSVSADSGTKTLAFTTGVASAGITLAVFKVPFWVDVFVTSAEDLWILDDGTFLAGPGHPVWVELASIWRISFFFAGLVFPPRVSKVSDDFSRHAVPLK